ncbi:MAG: NUDIX domain-containing protein [Bacteroidota bacterium]
MLLATDCIIFGFDKSVLKLLLVKRKVLPFQGQWSLMGSFVHKTEHVSAAASRVLRETTGLQDVFMEQLGVYGEVDRDPGDRVISLAYYALIRIGDDVQTSIATHAAEWFEFNQIPPLVLDHNRMVLDAIEKLRRKTRYRPIGFELLPEKFTIPQLRLLYEAIYQRELDRRNFRKKILSMNILEKLEEKDKSTSRKGAFLYRFNPTKYQQMIERGIEFIL